mgnify:CR=1 FL=1
MQVFADGKDIYCSSASQMFGVPVEKHGINGHLRQKGKIAELALGYGGSVGALKSMGALEMGFTEEELQPLVNAWRNANPMITALWWDIDRAVKTTVREHIPTEVAGLKFTYESGFLFMKLLSGRRLAYVKPRMGINQFGSESVTYEGVGATKKWERLESYGPKFCENAIQAIARDILMYAMQTLRNCSIVPNAGTSTAGLYGITEESNLSCGAAAPGWNTVREPAMPMLSMNRNYKTLWFEPLTWHLLKRIPCTMSCSEM